MTNVRLDHCVIHTSDWKRSNACYGDVFGAEVVPVGEGFSYRFGAQQLNAHGPGFEATPVAKIPAAPGGSDLCFEWSGDIEAAEAHLRNLGTETEMVRYSTVASAAWARASTSATRTGRCWSLSRTRTPETGREDHHE